MGRFAVRLAAVACLAFAGGCATLEDGHGYIPRQTDIDDVVLGLDTRDTVAVLLGRPGTTGVLSDNAWYYVASDYETVFWRAPVEVDRQVLAVSFDERGVVQNIERFGLEDGRVVVLSRRVTDSTVQGYGILRQIFSNIGNLSAGQFIDE